MASTVTVPGNKVTVAAAPASSTASSVSVPGNSVVVAAPVSATASSVAVPGNSVTVTAPGSATASSVTVPGSATAVSPTSYSGSYRWDGSKLVPTRPYRWTGSGLVPLFDDGSNSLAAMPASEPAGWTRIWDEDFSGSTYPIGSFTAHDINGIGTVDGAAASRYANKLSMGQFMDTGGYAQYTPSKTVSIRSDAVGASGNVLDIYNHTEAGLSMSAWLRPLTPDDADQRLTYGRFSIRMRADLMPGYGGVFLTIAKLWPDQGEDDWNEFEFIDDPQMLRAGGVRYGAGNVHPADPAGGSSPVFINDLPVGVLLRDWHVWTQEWSPGLIRYLMDGKVYLTTTTKVGSTPRQHVYQTGGDHGVPDPTVSGHVQIDYWTVARYKAAA